MDVGEALESPAHDSNPINVAAKKMIRAIRVNRSIACTGKKNLFATV
ncbi:MAG: hypothetical protein ACYDC3_05285 [Candidatus Binataceae bacterium]